MKQFAGDTILNGVTGIDLNWYEEGGFHPITDSEKIELIKGMVMGGVQVSQNTDNPKEYKVLLP